MVYLENEKAVEILSPTQIVPASSGYDGFVSIAVTITTADISDVEMFVGDYVNDDVTLTSGSMSTYDRRIYVT